jgi:hypothetical protein
MTDGAGDGRASGGLDLACLGAQVWMYFLRKPVTYLEESAAESPKWIKREWPRLYYHLSLRPWKRWLDHLRAHAFLLSFPKCGRTWLRLMVGRAIGLHFGVPEANLVDLRKLHRHHPGIPRILVEHDDDPFWKRPEELCPRKTAYRHKKVIFLVRDPRDVVVSSFFHKSKREGRYSGTLSEYVREPVGGIDTVIEYYNIWERNAGVPASFLRVTYEEMHGDPAAVLRRVLGFLGCGGVSDAVVSDAVSFTSFDNMRKLEEANRFGMQGKAPGSGEEARKVRRGRVGGYREALRPEEIDYLNGRLRERLSPSYGYSA